MPEDLELHQQNLECAGKHLEVMYICQLFSGLTGMSG